MTDARAPGVDQGEFITELWARVREHSGLVLAAPVAAGLIAVAASYALPVRYTAESAFVPEQKQVGGSLGGLASLASQVGVSIGGQVSESPQFYGELLRTVGVRLDVLRRRYATQRDTVVLLDALVRANGDERRREGRGLKVLEQRTGLSVDPRTNVIRVRFEAGDPVLAAQVANGYAAAVDRFNQETRRSRARERRAFVEARAAHAQRELETAEEALRDFYERNRDYGSSPTLANRERQLRRQVDLRGEVYLTLRREQETARIEEFNDLPLISVVDSARVPLRKSSPRRGFLGMSALLVATALAVAYAVACTADGRWRVTGRPVMPAFLRRRHTSVPRTA